MYSKKLTQKLNDINFLLSHSDTKTQHKTNPKNSTEEKLDKER